MRKEERRDRLVKSVLNRVKTAIQALENSKDLDFTQKYVSFGKERGFSVECERMEDDLVDEDGNVIYERKGAAVGFVVYYQENGRDQDSCSLSYFSDEENMRSVAAFVKMYV